MSYNLIIKNGRVIDGCGNPWFKADVAVKRGKIARIGQVKSAQADEIIDATDLVVSPGFIDIHGHSEITLLVNPKAESHIRQGITTQIIGLCGSSAAPLKGNVDWIANLWAQDAESYGVKADWTTFREYFNRLERQGIALNIGSYVGHGTVRGCVDLLEDRLPSEEEMEKMKSLVAEAMEDGAIGLSTGLTFAPGCFAKTEEIIELCKVVTEYGGHYVSHIRGLSEGIFEATEEATEIGFRAVLPVELSHFLPGPANFRKAPELLKLCDEARLRGIDVTLDNDTYIVDDMLALTLLPDWVREGAGRK